MPVNTLLTGPQVRVDGSTTTPRGDNYGNMTVVPGGPSYAELTRRGYGFVYSQPAAGVNLFPAAITASVTTGAFVTGRRYKITNVGDTDFTLIGAASNTLGVEFVATGAGGGTTGTANVMNSTLMVWNKSTTGYWFIPTRVTVGFIGAVAIVTGNMALYVLTSPGDSSGVISVPTANAGTPVRTLVGGTASSVMTFSATGQDITTLPSLVRTFGWTALANDLTGKNMAALQVDLQGQIILKPNNALFIAPNAAMAALAIVSLEGFEVPAPSGTT